VYIYKKNNNLKRTSNDGEVNTTNMTTKKITQNSSISCTNLSNVTFISYLQAYVLLVAYHRFTIYACRPKYF